MNEYDDEKALLNEAPDYENQLSILEEEHKESLRKKRRYILLLSMFVFIVLIFYISYSTVYYYHEYGGNGGNGHQDTCNNVNIFGDRTELFNKINQMDETGNYCILNCDRDNDGWPDYNIDLNGDGVADINIVKDPKNSKGDNCDLNCDSNFDTLPDYNIDIDGDGNADVNIKDEKDDKLYNVDYKGNREPIFNIINHDGTITNPVVNIKDNPNCTANCDIDGDGHPDYNIQLHKGNDLLNEKIGDNKYINIDIDGDGKPDINISNDNGNTITNPINQKVTVDDKEIILNEDTDGDGFPDNNIDIDGDGKPDINITDGNGKCVKNCDTNGDGKPDNLIEINDNIYTIRDVNIDIDYDGVCDTNCDINYDLFPDINIDTNGDIVPDINIDFDHDGKPDFNIDSDGDGKPDINIDIYGIGECNFNCQQNNGRLINPVDNSSKCTKNCDTNGDGLPDINVDINNDGVCDFNCNNGQTKIDKNGNYLIDDKEKMASVDIENNDEYDFLILNSLDIKAESIDPGWNAFYIITIKNDTYSAVAYNLEWQNVTNTFSVYNLEYSITRNNTNYIDNQAAPYKAEILKSALLIRPKTTIKYMVNMEWKETGTNQNVDSGKTFSAIFTQKVLK